MFLRGVVWGCITLPADGAQLVASTLTQCARAAVMHSLPTAVAPAARPLGPTPRSLPIRARAEDRIVCGVTDVCFSATGRLMIASYMENYVCAWETISKDGCVLYFGTDVARGRAIQLCSPLQGHPTTTRRSHLQNDPMRDVPSQNDLRAHVPFPPVHCYCRPPTYVQHVPRAQGPQEPRLVRRRQLIGPGAVHRLVGYGACHLVRVKGRIFVRYFMPRVRCVASRIAFFSGCRILIHPTIDLLTDPHTSFVRLL